MFRPSDFTRLATARKPCSRSTVSPSSRIWLFSMLNLPKLSGFAVLDHCAARGVPLVVFSSSSREEDARRAAGLGAREYVRKPFDIDVYLGAVQEMVYRWVKPGLA